LDSFLFEAVSAALPAVWGVECRYMYESARVLTTDTSHVRGLPPCPIIAVKNKTMRMVNSDRYRL